MIRNTWQMKKLVWLDKRNREEEMQCLLQKIKIEPCSPTSFWTGLSVSSLY